MRRVARLCVRPLAFAVLVLCLWTGSVAAVEKSSSFRAALESITATDLQGHVDYLADESRQGREAGTQGGYDAGNYLAAQLERLKIRSAGTDGGYFQVFMPNFRNVIGVIEGRDPQLKQQVIVLGAHYDHIGLGTPRNSRGAAGHIHPGADDNASGTSGLLKIAQAFRMLDQPTKRTVLFAFFDAEEKEMLGSKHWLAYPTVPRDQVVMMFNLDMIGRVRDDRVVVFGSRTGQGLRRLVSLQNDAFGLKLDFSWQLQATADHYPFFQAGIPELMFHTDVHDDYHRPGDVARLINSAGMQRVARLAFAVAYEIAEQDRVPEFRAAARHESNEVQRQFLQPQTPLPDRLGAGWDTHVAPGQGVRLSWVNVGSAAARAGLQAGDHILRFAGQNIASADDLIGAITGAASPATVVAHRPGNGQTLQVMVPLDGAPLRLGIAWRVDDAEPGAVVLTRVVPGSPAARAGLTVGDRIYQIDGQDFADDNQFGQKARMLPSPIKILVERDGRLHMVEIHTDAAASLRRAA